MKSHRLSRRLRGGWWRCGARLKLACGWNGGLHEAKQPRSGNSADDKRRASLTLSSGILVQTAWVHRLSFTRLGRTGCHGACVVGRQEAKQGASQLPVARRAFASREAGSLWEVAQGKRRASLIALLGLKVEEYEDRMLPNKALKLTRSAMAGGAALAA